MLIWNPSIWDWKQGQIVYLLKFRALVYPLPGEHELAYRIFPCFVTGKMCLLVYIDDDVNPFV